MRDFKFTPSDFELLPFDHDELAHLGPATAALLTLEAARLANLRLKEMLEEEPHVYGQDDGDPDNGGVPQDWTIVRHGWESHSARLVDIRELKKGEEK